MGKASTRSLYAVIHITRKEIWGDERQPYEDMLGNFYGAGSSTELSYREKLDFIDRLKAIQEGKPQPSINRRGGLWASQEQINKVNALEGAAGWDNPKRMTGFIKRQTKKNKSRHMLTGKEASKVIIGLQRIIAGGNNDLYTWLNTATADIIDSDRGHKKIQSFTN